MWPGLELLIWYAVYFQAMSLTDKQWWRIEARASGIFFFSNWKHISTTTGMTTKLGRMVTYLEALLTIKSHYALITWSCKVTWQTKIIFSTTRLPMTTKLGSMVTYFDRFLLIISHGFLITWSCEITWQTKAVISALLQCLWSLNLVGWW